VTDHENRKELAKKAREVSSIYSIENTTKIMSDRYQKLYLDYRQSKPNLLKRIIRPFRRTMN
jgi:hypothetical protein